MNTKSYNIEEEYWWYQQISQCPKPIEFNLRSRFPEHIEYSWEPIAAHPIDRITFN